MDDPDTWRWVWLITALVFAVGEMATPGSFILLPFALGALAASGISLLDVSLAGEWAVFVGVTVATLVALRPVSRRLDRTSEDHGIGSRRLLGQEATVVEDIPGSSDLGLGLVLINREEWRAESTDGTAIPTGTHVRIADVRGTRVVVAPAGSLSPGQETA